MSSAHAALFDEPAPEGALGLVRGSLRAAHRPFESNGQQCHRWVELIHYQHHRGIKSAATIQHNQALKADAAKLRGLAQR